MVWIKDQISHNIPLKPKPNPLTLLNFMQAGRDEEAAEEKLETSRGWFIRFKERSCFHHIEAQGEAGSADVEAAAGYPEDISEIINQGGYTQQQILNVEEQHCIERICHLELAQLERRNQCLISKLQRTG